MTTEESACPNATSNQSATPRPGENGTTGLGHTNVGSRKPRRGTYLSNKKRSAPLPALDDASESPQAIEEAGSGITTCSSAKSSNEDSKIVVESGTPLPPHSLPSANGTFPPPPPPPPPQPPPPQSQECTLQAVNGNKVPTINMEINEDEGLLGRDVVEIKQASNNLSARGTLLSKPKRQRRRVVHDDDDDDNDNHNNKQCDVHISDEARSNERSLTPAVIAHQRTRKDAPALTPSADSSSILLSKVVNGGDTKNDSTNDKACSESKEEDEEDEEDEEEDEEEDDDDAGSLVDFIVEDDEVEEEEEEDDDDDDESVDGAPPKTKEEAIRRDLDGIDPNNIISGKRTRRQTQFYETEVFSSPEYKRMMLCDVPEDEMHALEEDDDEDEEDDEEDDLWHSDDDKDDDDDDCDDCDDADNADAKNEGNCDTHRSQDETQGDTTKKTQGNVTSVANDANATRVRESKKKSGNNVAVV